jgi:SAM-dependent methyltransferase
MVCDVVVPGARHKGIVFREHLFALQLLGNLSGVELGAASHNPFKLPGSINVAPNDDSDFDFYKQHQVDMCGKYAASDLPGEAGAIPLGDNTQDYVVSSHVMEHVPDFIGAVRESVRVIRPGGFLFMIVPTRVALEADRVRGVTPLVVFKQAAEEKWTCDTVPVDVVRAGGGKRGHIWVLSPARLREVCLLASPALRVLFEEAQDSKVGNGHTIVLQKT